MTKTQLMTTRYHATFEFDESGVWIAQIEEIPQVHTFGRTLGKAREYLVDALALWLDVPIDNVKDSIEICPVVLPIKVQSTVDEANAARVIAEATTETAGALMSDAALALTKDARLSVRDAAELLGISHQRVQQLVSEGKGSLALTGSGSQGVAQDIARSLKEFLPGGSKEDLGAIAAVVALGVAIAWTQSRE
jgi:predicted RNase H-like HicB family nuclease/predicted transcriptional regulator